MPCDLVIIEEKGLDPVGIGLAMSRALHAVAHGLSMTLQPYSL